MRYLVIIEKGASGFGAQVPDLPGCFAVADTRDEVLSLIREAIAFHIEGILEEGGPVPTARSEATIVEIGAA